jgi:hypothetical protein
MSDKKLTTFLSALDKLEARALPLSGKAGRGREAPLFKALADLSPGTLQSKEGAEAVDRLIAAFAERLGDFALLPAMLSLFGDRPDFGEKLQSLLGARKDSDHRWGAERLLALEEPKKKNNIYTQFQESLDEDPKSWPLQKAIKVLEIRSRTPVNRRDPVSTKICDKALQRLALSLDNAKGRDWIVKTIIWETARTGKEEPTLALAGIETLKSFPPIMMLRAVKQLLISIKRRVCVQRIEKIRDMGQEVLGLPPEQINDVMEAPYTLPEWFVFDMQGQLKATVGEEHGDYSVGYERQIQREAERVIEQWTTRLDSALTNEELWPLEAWRSIYVDAACAVRTSLCERLVWGCYKGAEKPIYARFDGSNFTDVFGEKIKEDFQWVGIAHPLNVDMEELGLWREGLVEARDVQPFPQLFRLFFPKAPLDKFTGCFFPSDPPRLGRSRSYVGLPIRGRSSSHELIRKFGDNEVTIYVEGREQRIHSVMWLEEPTKIQESEFARDLFDMVGASFFGDHAYWNQWNSGLKTDKNTWNSALALYKRAPKRLPALRLKILQNVMKDLLGSQYIRCEGRFVIVDSEEGGIVELGSGNQHMLEHRSFVPPRDHNYREVALPHERSTDPQLDRILGLIAYLGEKAHKAVEKDSA